MTVVFTSILGCFMYKTPLRLFLDSTVIPICFYILTKTCAQREDFIQNLGRTVTIALIIMGTLGAIETLGGVDVLHCDFERYDDLFRTNGPMVIAEHFGLTVDF